MHQIYESSMAEWKYIAAWEQVKVFNSDTEIKQTFALVACLR